MLNNVLIEYDATDLARWAGCHRSTSYEWRAGLRPPATEHLLRLIQRGPDELQHRLLEWIASQASGQWSVIPAGDFDVTRLDVDRDGDVDSEDLTFQASIVASSAAQNASKTHRRLRRRDEEARLESLQDGSFVIRGELLRRAIEHHLYQSRKKCARGR